MASSFLSCLNRTYLEVFFTLACFKSMEGVNLLIWHCRRMRQACLKGQCHEIFCFWFFHESVSPQPQSIPVGPFQIYSKIHGDIRKSTTTVANFATSFASVVDSGGKFATGVNLYRWAAILKNVSLKAIPIHDF
jgi:hypothetical protein